MRADDGRIDHLQRGVGHPASGERFQDHVPDAAVGPPAKLPKDRIPLAEFIWQVAPWRARSHYPKHGVKHAAMVPWRPPAVMDQERFEIRPLFVGHQSTNQGRSPQRAALNQFAIPASMGLSTRPSQARAEYGWTGAKARVARPRPNPPVLEMTGRWLGRQLRSLNHAPIHMAASAGHLQPAMKAGSDDRRCAAAGDHRAVFVPTVTAPSRFFTGATLWPRRALLYLGHQRVPIVIPASRDDDHLRLRLRKTRYFVDNPSQRCDLVRHALEPRGSHVLIRSLHSRLLRPSLAGQTCRVGARNLVMTVTTLGDCRVRSARGRFVSDDERIPEIIRRQPSEPGVSVQRVGTMSLHGVALALLVMPAVAAAGLALGEIRLAGVRLGVGGVLFAGLATGQLGFAVDETILMFVREFGLVLFVYGIGISRFPLYCCAPTCGRDPSHRKRLAGSARPASGGTTNTPSLAASQQVIADIEFCWNPRSPTHYVRRRVDIGVAIDIITATSTASGIRPKRNRGSHARGG